MDNKIRLLIASVSFFPFLLFSGRKTFSASSIDQYCHTDENSGNISIAKNLASQTFTPKHNRLTSIIMDIEGDGVSRMVLMINKKNDDGTPTAFSTNEVKVPKGRGMVTLYFDNYKMTPGIEYKITPGLSAFRDAVVNWYTKKDCYSGGAVYMSKDAQYPYGTVDFGFETYGYTYIPVTPITPQLPKTTPDQADNIDQPGTDYPDAKDFDIPEGTDKVPDVVKNDYTPNVPEVDIEEENIPNDGDNPLIPEPKEPDNVYEEGGNDMYSYPTVAEPDTQSEENGSVKPPSISLAVANLESVDDLSKVIELSNKGSLVLYGEGHENSTVHIKIGGVTYAIETNQEGHWFSPIPLEDLTEGLYIISGVSITDNGLKSKTANLLTIEIKIEASEEKSSTISNNEESKKSIINNKLSTPFFLLILLLLIINGIFLYIHISKKKRLKANKKELNGNEEITKSS